MGIVNNSAPTADRDTEAVTAPAAGQPNAAAAAMALDSTTETAAKLVAASKSPVALARYASALRNFDARRADHDLAEDDRSAILDTAHLSDLGRAAQGRVATLANLGSWHVSAAPPLKVLVARQLDFNARAAPAEHSSTDRSGPASPRFRAATRRVRPRR